VLQADGRRFGLVVDRVNDTQEIVVKPLSPVTRENPPFSGATVLGDGRAALILDVASLARRTGVINSEDLPARVDVADDAPSREGTQETLLLFGLGREGRLAVPLSLVTRLEQFPRSAVETSGKHDVVQYRGQILPLIWLSRVLDTDEAVLGGEDGSASSERQAAALTEHRAGGRPRGRRTDIDPSTEHRERSERLRVLVHSCDDRSVGLVVDRIFDVVEETVTLLDSPIHRPGIIGTSVIRERVTDLLDLPGVIRANVPEFFEGMRG
jgi:two-component system chemotaxis sensor kinase CheA